MATSAPLPDLVGGTDDGAACIWDAEDEAATLDVVDNHRLSSAEIRKKCLFQSKAPPCPRTRKGMLHSVPNINRHKPIKYEMFGLEGIKSISSMVRDFRSALYPWGGCYRFKSNSKWIDGPVDFFLYADTLQSRNGAHGRPRTTLTTQNGAHGSSPT